MPVIKKPRYVAQIKGESVVRLFFPSLPLSLSFLSSFFPLSLFFFLLPAAACSVAQGRFISDEIVGKMSSRTERCKCASGTASPLEKWTPGRGSSHREEETRTELFEVARQSPFSSFDQRRSENRQSSVWEGGGGGVERKKREGKGKERKGKKNGGLNWSDIYFFFFINKLKIWKNLLDVVVVEIDMYK